MKAYLDLSNGNVVLLPESPSQLPRIREQRADHAALRALGMVAYAHEPNAPTCDHGALLLDGQGDPDACDSCAQFADAVRRYFASLGIVVNVRGSFAATFAVWCLAYAFHVRPTLSAVLSLLP